MSRRRPFPTNRVGVALALAAAVACAPGTGPSDTPTSARDQPRREAAAGARARPPASTQPAAARRPNVLLIVLDDVNDWVGYLGRHPQAHTPAIDRLASRGVAFTAAYAPAPACSPSRASLLTGLRPSTTGIYDNDQEFLPFLESATTLPRYFAANGYRVLGIGKIFHNVPRSKIEPFWSEFADFPASAEERGHRNLNGLGRTAWDWGPLSEPAEKTRDGQRVSWVADKLAQAYDTPFLLAVGLRAAHIPWYVPQEYFDRVPLAEVSLPPTRPDDLDDVPEPGRRLVHPDDAQALERAGLTRAAVQAYLAAVAFADAQVGRILDALEASPHRDDTIVVLCSDNGWHLGEKGQWRKFTLWEESTHVPLVVVAPGVGVAGGRSAGTVDLSDVLPTLVDLAGLPPLTTDGTSLRPLLAAPDGDWPHAAVMTHHPGNHAVRFGAWRYIRYEDGSEELYDHDVDPHEWTNLAGRPEHAKLVARLARFLPAKDAPPTPRLKGRAGEDE